MPLSGFAVAECPTRRSRAPRQRQCAWFDRNPLPMWIFCRKTFAFLAVNEAAIRHYGYTLREFLGMTIKDIRPVREIPHLVALMRTAHSGQTQKALVRHRTKDGRILDVEIYSQQGTWQGRSAELVQILDITERKRAEEALRNLSGRLLQIQDEQKRRIARELHDAFGQNLAALSANLAVINNSAQDLDANAMKSLGECMGLVEKTCKDIRTLSYLLHPPMLDEEGLASALDLFVEGFAQRSGIKVNLAIPDDLERLPQELETALFRIVQEALTNIHHHSGSASAEVRVLRRPAALVLEVRDRGTGIRPELLERIRRGGASVGVGIAGMRERLAQLGGRLEIQSSARGTTVKAVLPGAVARSAA